jgi:hypothetical protein
MGFVSGLIDSPNVATPGGWSRCLTGIATGKQSSTLAMRSKSIELAREVLRGIVCFQQSVNFWSIVDCAVAARAEADEVVERVGSAVGAVDAVVCLDAVRAGADCAFAAVALFD